MKRRKRRTASDVSLLREHFLKAVQKEGRISLTDLINGYGPSVGIKNTPSDKNLIKRQLDRLAREGSIEFDREGRDLVAHSTGQSASQRAPSGSRSVETARSNGAEIASDLKVIRAYAAQLEEFSKTLQQHISTLVRMVEKASG